MATWALSGCIAKQVIAWIRPKTSETRADPKKGERGVGRTCVGAPGVGMGQVTPCSVLIERPFCDRREFSSKSSS